MVLGPHRFHHPSCVALSHVSWNTTFSIYDFHVIVAPPPAQFQKLVTCIRSRISTRAGGKISTTTIEMSFNTHPSLL